MFFLLFREKLIEVYEELQKKQEFIEDFQLDISQNGKCLLKFGLVFLGFVFFSEGDKNRFVFIQCVQLGILYKNYVIFKSLVYLYMMLF